MDLNWIKDKVQNIVTKSFSENDKRRLNVLNDRINIACPYCGDSHKNAHKKRGNLYLDTLLYVCFNCDKKTTFDKMCKDFDEYIDPDKKMELIEHYEKTLTFDSYQDDVFSSQLDKLFKFEDIEKLLTSGDAPLFDFKRLNPNGFTYQKLIDRGIPIELHKNIFEAYSWKNKLKGEKEKVMVFLNMRDDKVLGLQTRNLKEGKNRDFKIYNYQSIYELMYKTEADAFDISVYNKLSYYFNILNINFDEKITIFEGYLDSLFYPNSIGCVGVNTSLDFFENNGLDIQYFYDNDMAGFTKTDEKIKSGFNCFLWNKLIEDVIKRKKTDDPYSMEYRLKKIKDLNKLASLVPNPYKTLELENYFSRDVFDLNYVPKIIKQNELFVRYTQRNKLS